MRTAARAKRKGKWRAVAFRLVRWLVYALLALHLVCGLAMVALRWIDPPTTAVQTQRRVESWFSSAPYKKRYKVVPLNRISKDLRHAVIAAEDGRFYEHHGIDWKELKKVIEDDIEHGRVGRGGSTISQQLVKNLFLTTQRSFLRKGLEFTLVPIAELTLSKERILELYLNVIEWGPGVYGAEAAAQYHYKSSAARIGRDKAARLAACIPSPRRRKPGRMNEYSDEILDRMNKMGW